ncbi:sigma-70 family RNA polymerase sigma factor [Bremerella sp. JC770]|uniref:sigma-70 family RNA polymerase sigma factor n=1 Tax=Bremerella sp. JC770 TaxID=3232137 RepID=UPI00345ADDF9
MSAEATQLEQRIQENQGLVISLAKSIHRKLPPQIGMDDLIAYGQLGLAEAAQSFEDDKGASFSTFAYYRIRGAIYDGISKMSWNSHAARMQNKYQQMAADTLQSEAAAGGSTTASAEENAKWLGNLTEKLAVVYLASHGEETQNAFQSVADARTQQPAERLENEEIQRLLQKLLKTLAPHEQKLIRMTYYEGMSLKEAADHLGKSKSWASRLHQAILERLARALRQTT